MEEMRFNDCGCGYEMPRRDDCHECGGAHMDCGCEMPRRDCECEFNRYHRMDYEYERCNKFNGKAILDLIESIKEVKKGLFELKRGKEDIFRALCEIEESMKKLREAVCHIEKGESEIAASLHKVEEGLCVLLKDNLYC